MFIMFHLLNKSPTRRNPLPGNSGNHFGVVKRDPLNGFVKGPPTGESNGHLPWITWYQVEALMDLGGESGGKLENRYKRQTPSSPSPPKKKLNCWNQRFLI